MGDKIRAKETMEKAGLPGIPGSQGNIDHVRDARRLSKEMGYPVILKAAAGGGGKGMRIARNDEELDGGFRIAQAEAKAAFGDSRIYLEKLSTKPRHIEVQILGDNYDTVIALGERECSIQRRHQKLVEESPSVAVDEALRKKLITSALTAAQTRIPLRRYR